MKRATILVMSWRDIKSPNAGGAEVNTHNMLKTLDENEFRVIHFSPLYRGLIPYEVIDNVEYVRQGGVLSVIFFAYRYYKSHNREFDLVIEECNTHRFFAPLWTPCEKRVFLIYQLTREIWNINLIFPFNKIGYLLENAMLRLNKYDTTITESQSTKDDLISVGYYADNIHIIPIGIDERILSKNIGESSEKENVFIYVGRYSKYKGIDVAVEALGKIKAKYPDARLNIIGKKSDGFVEDVIMPISRKYELTVGNEKCDINLCGFVSESKKFELMSESKALLFPSIREGWGIIVTEAAALGTPSIVYNSPGAVDAVDYGRAGYLCSENTPDGVAQMMIRAIENREEYITVRKAAKEYSYICSWERNKNALAYVLREKIKGTNRS